MFGYLIESFANFLCGIVFMIKSNTSSQHLREKLSLIELRDI